MNARVAAAKRLSIVLSAAGQESDFPDFTSTSAKNALEKESAFVMSAAGRALSRLHRSQTEPRGILVAIIPILGSKPEQSGAARRAVKGMAGVHAGPPGA